MATYRRLTVGQRPVVVCFPEWLLHDMTVGASYRALRRALGPVPVYVDAEQVVVVVPIHLLDDDEASWALHRLQDEITVWRLSTADGTRRSGPGAADVTARVARNERRAGSAPMLCGWTAA